ncbi:MAG: hypothetical protein WA709_01040 [Stellaceae bacterium]
MTLALRLVVIYATGSKSLRRKIILDHESQLDLHQPGPGESRLLLPLSAPFDDAACRAAIAVATGAEPFSGRCCVIDADSNVVGVCNADPTLDTHPAGRLVAHDVAGPGDRYEDGVFKREYAIVDNATLKVSTRAYLPLDNPMASETSFIVPAGQHKIGDVLWQKAIAVAPR